MKTLSITRVSELTGLTTATIRFYESKGLIAPIGRKGLTRIYAQEVLTQLSLRGCVPISSKSPKFACSPLISRTTADI